MGILQGQALVCITLALSPQVTPFGVGRHVGLARTGSSRRFGTLGPTTQEQMLALPLANRMDPTKRPRDYEEEPSPGIDTKVAEGVPSLKQELRKDDSARYGLPPFQVDDRNLLFYDVFLLLNLSASISFHVVHRMAFGEIGIAISEGALMCLLWIIAGLRRGTFLYSAATGHKGIEMKNGGGVTGATLLGLTTFIDAACLRVCLALVVAFFEHRPVGSAPGEDLMLLEISFGIVLMSVWRALHSYSTRF